MAETIPPTRIFLIRHGVVAPESRNRFNGATDAPLDPVEGPAQIERVADYLAESSPVRLYSSPLARCLASARILGDKFDLEAIVEDDLREMHFGRLEGMSFQEVRKTYPQEMAAWFADLAAYRIDGGETMADVQDRAWPAIERIVEANSGRAAAVVAHGAVNRLILAKALGIEIQRVLNLSQDYGCLNVLDFFPDNVVIKGVNIQPGPRFPGEPLDQT